MDRADGIKWIKIIPKLFHRVNEANESKYWLKIIKELHITSPSKTDKLLNEVTELAKILGAIVSTAAKKQTTNKN